VKLVADRNKVRVTLKFWLSLCFDCAFERARFSLCLYVCWRQTGTDSEHCLRTRQCFITTEFVPCITIIFSSF